MLKNGEKTEAYLKLSRESIGVNLINIKIEDDKTKIVALTEEIPEVKNLMDIINDESINGCVVDYSSILQNPSGIGGLLYVDTYIRKDGIVTFFSLKEWDYNLDDVISVKHKED